MTYRTTSAPPQPDRSILVVGLNGEVVGVDRITGKIRWQNNLPGGSMGEVFIAVNYGVVVASASGDRIYCLDYLTGQQRWASETSGAGRATIVIEPDVIVCVKNGYLDCFSPQGGLLWSQRLEGKGLGRAALGFPGNVAQADDVGSQ
jgi:outer membrane protein assembly factor BamB